MRLTGPRVDKRDEYLLLRRTKVLSSEEYKTLVQKLEKQESGVIKRKEKAIAKKEAKQAEKARLRAIESKAKAVARRERAAAKRVRNKKILSSGVLSSGFFSPPVPWYNEEFYDVFKKAWEGTTSETLRCQFSGYAETQERVKKIDQDVSFPRGNSLNEGYSRLRLSLHLASDESVTVASSTFYTGKLMKAARRKQSFRDGLVHCVLTPIRLLYESMADSYTNKNAISNRRTILNRLDVYDVDYADGVPEETMETVCKALGVRVTVYDILDNKLFDFNSGCKRNHLSFCNTRINHIEQGRLCLNGKPEEVSEDEMMDILSDVLRAGDHYMFEGDPKNMKPRVLRTLNGCWKVKDKARDDMRAMNEENYLDDYALDATKNKEVNAYIKEATVVNSTSCSIAGGVPIDHLDLKHAYAQFGSGKFLGKIHQWGRCVGGTEFVKKHIGIYRFKIHGEVPWYLKKLGLKTGGLYTLPSVEVLWIAERVAVSIVSGVWGSEATITMTPEMMDERKLYQIWAGRLGMECNSRVFQFPCSEDEASHLAGVLGEDNVQYFEYTETVRVFNPKTVVKTLHHMFAFITSYTRINILAKMEEIGFENVTNVVLDGIYLKVEGVADEKFRRKPINIHTESRCWYHQSKVSDEFMPLFNTMFQRGVAGNVFLAGGGGSGKSFSILNGGRYNDILYVVPTRALGFAAAEKYKCKWTTVHKLIGHKDAAGKKTRTWAEENMRTPAVVFIDELTMIESSMIEDAIRLYKNSLIILAGDVEGKQWFQCRNGGDSGSYSKIYDVSSWDCVKYTMDFRAKDSKLKELKLKVREKMRAWRGEGGRVDAAILEDWLVEQVDVVPYAEAIQLFDGDIWIAPTHKISEQLVKDGVSSGHRVKWERAGYSRGEIVDKAIEGLTEHRGSLTTHSIQGQTIADKKIFISVYGSFEYAMLYTAISRAEYYDQLVFVV